MKASTKTDRRAWHLQVVSLVCLFCSAFASAASERLPNIIVVLADDLGYGDLGVYGSTLLETPRLDAMARQGVMLTDFYASASNCTPSRAGLLTGRYAIRSGLAHQVLFVHDKHGLPREEVHYCRNVAAAGLSHRNHR